MNNLRQIGLAINMHVTTKKYFPTAGSNVGGAPGWDTTSPNGFERGSCFYQMLPYIEQRLLYDPTKKPPVLPQTLASQQVPAFGGKDLMEMQVSTYNCPSRSDRSAFYTDTARLYRPNDYAGVFTNYELNDWNSTVYAPSDMPIDNPTANSGFPPIGRTGIYRGIIVKGGHNATKWPTLRPSQVSDGFSKTLAIAEKSAWDKYWTYVGPSTINGNYLYWDDNGWAYGSHWVTMRTNRSAIRADNALRLTSTGTVAATRDQASELGFGSAAQHRL